MGHRQLHALNPGSSFSKQSKHNAIFLLLSVPPFQFFSAVLPRSMSLAGPFWRYWAFLLRFISALRRIFSRCVVVSVSFPRCISRDFGFISALCLVFRVVSVSFPRCVTYLARFQFDFRVVYRFSCVFGFISALRYVFRVISVSFPRALSLVEARYQC